MSPKITQACNVTRCPPPPYGPGDIINYYYYYYYFEGLDIHLQTNKLSHSVICYLHVFEYPLILIPTLSCITKSNNNNCPGYNDEDFGNKCIWIGDRCST